MGKVLLLGLVLLIVGCSGHHEPPAEGHEPPVLRVSASLSPVLQAAVMTAAGNWQAAGLEFTVELAPDERANVKAGSCLHLSPSAAACAYPRAWVLLDPEALSLRRCRKEGPLTRCYVLDATAIATHELGHWLGYDSHLPEGNVMQPNLNAWDEIPHLTNEDITAVTLAYNAREK